MRRKKRRTENNKNEAEGRESNKIVKEGIKTLRRENNKIVEEEEEGIKKFRREIKMKRERVVGKTLCAV